MNKHEFVFDADKQTVINSLLYGVIISDPLKNITLFEKDAIYGRVSKNTNKIFLYHGSLLRYYRPIFSGKIIEGEKTVISGIWRLPVRANIFFAMWYLFLICISILPLLTDATGNLPLLYAVVAFFAVLGAVHILLGYLIENKRMKKVIEHIENVQKRLRKDV